MESDDIKYVLNMIISAVDLDKLDLDDIEEIAKKFERDEEEPTSGEEEVPSEEEPSSEDEDLGEDAMSALDEFINTPIQSDEIDMSNYDLGHEVSEEDESTDSYEIDIDEIKNDINNSISSTLSKYFK
jgi:hypothetical protein